MSSHVLYVLDRAPCATYRIAHGAHRKNVPNLDARTRFVKIALMNRSVSVVKCFVKNIARHALIA